MTDQVQHSLLRKQLKAAQEKIKVLEAESKHNKALVRNLAAEKYRRKKRVPDDSTKRKHSQEGDQSASAGLLPRCQNPVGVLSHRFFLFVSRSSCSHRSDFPQFAVAIDAVPQESFEDGHELLESV